MTLVPDFRLVKTIGRCSQTILTKIQNRKLPWPCNPKCARICPDYQTVSAVQLVWWLWELHDTCFATLDFVISAPNFWSLVAAVYTIHRLPVESSVNVVVRLQAGWPRIHYSIPVRGKSFFIIPWNLWDRLWIPVVAGGSFPEGKAARTWSWPHLRLLRI